MPSLPAQLSHQPDSSGALGQGWGCSPEPDGAPSVGREGLRERLSTPGASWGATVIVLALRGRGQ